MTQERPTDQPDPPELSVQTSRSRLKTVVKVGSTVTLVGLAGWGVIDLEIRARNAIVDLRESDQRSASERPQTPQFVYDQERRIVPDDLDLRESIRSTLHAYTQWEGFGRRNLQRLLHEEQPQETAKLLEEIGKNFVLEGVNILKTAWLVGYIQDQVMVDFAEENLRINDYQFDLKDRFQRQLAGAWIQTKVTRLEKQLSINLKRENEDIGELPVEVESLSENLAVLEWLKARNPNITMDEETFAFFPRDEMVATARVFAAVDRLNFDIPQQVEWCATECLRNIPGKDVIVNDDGTLKVERKGKTGGIPTPDDGIRLRNTNLAASLAHEIGHLVNDESNYLQRFVQIRGHEGVAPHISERWKYISLYAMADKHEDFAETFEQFMMDGERFRATLSELAVRDPASWQMLKAKYDFIKNEIWQGLEFARNGRIRNLEMETKEQEFAGISWNVETRSVTIKPTPEAWPQKRKVFKSFPVLVDGEMKNVVVDFRHDPETNSYEVYASPMGLVSKINLRPSNGNDRIAIRTRESGLARFVEKGTQEQFEIASGLIDSSRNWRLTAENFSPVAVGQKRQVKDNEERWSGRDVALRANPRLSTGEDTRMKDGQVVQVVDGPLTIHDEYTDLDELFWQVKDERRDATGWVSQRWLGAETNP